MKKHRDGYWDRVAKLLFQNALLMILLQAAAGFIKSGNGRLYAAASFFICFFGQLLCLYFWDTPEKDPPTKPEDGKSDPSPKNNP